MQWIKCLSLRKTRITNTLLAVFKRLKPMKISQSVWWQTITSPKSCQCIVTVSVLGLAHLWNHCNTICGWYITKQTRDDRETSSLKSNHQLSKTDCNQIIPVSLFILILVTGLASWLAYFCWLSWYDVAVVILGYVLGVPGHLVYSLVPLLCRDCEEHGKQKTMEIKEHIRRNLWAKTQENNVKTFSCHTEVLTIIKFFYTVIRERG